VLRKLVGLHELPNPALCVNEEAAVFLGRLLGGSNHCAIGSLFRLHFCRIHCEVGKHQDTLRAIPQSKVISKLSDLSVRLLVNDANLCDLLFEAPLNLLCLLSRKQKLPTGTDNIELRRSKLQTNSLSLFRLRTGGDAWNCKKETKNECKQEYLHRRVC